MTDAHLTVDHKPNFFLGLLHRLRGTQPAQSAARRLDRRTLRAIRHLPPHMLKDIGVSDYL